MGERHGDRRASERAWSNGESAGQKLPEQMSKPWTHTEEKEAARQEEVEMIKALREKVSLLKLAQADNEAQIAILKEQVAATTEETLPALTGERVRQLKKYQEDESVSSAALAEYEKKLRAAEAQYNTAFPNAPLE